MAASTHADTLRGFPRPSQVPHHPAMAAEEGFHDSDFDWDALTARPPVRAADRPNTVTDRLAWIVLLLLVFCPPLGYVLATLWH